MWKTLLFWIIFTPILYGESPDLIASSPNSAAHLYLLPSFEFSNSHFNNATTNSRTYVLIYNNAPVALIPKTDDSFLFAWTSSSSDFFFADQLKLILIDCSSGISNIQNLDTSPLLQYADKLIPSSEKGSIVHEWFATLASSADSSIEGTYIRAKYPNTFLIPFVVKCVNKNGIVEPHFKLKKAIPLKWGEKAPPNYPRK